MVDIIAYFNYNNKKFVFVNENNIIKFYIKDRNNFTSSLSKEEINLCFKILDSITINKKNSVYLYNKRINNNVYQIFYDIKTRLYWWTLLYGNKDIQEDNIQLHFFYNNMPDIYFMDTQDTDIDSTDTTETRFIMLKRFIGRTLLTVFLSTTVSFLTVKAIETYRTYKFEKETIERLDDERIKTTGDLETFLSGNFPDEETANILRDEINSEQEYNWQNIEEAIESNSNLTQSEKDFIKKLKFFFDKNHEYMNIDMIIDNFRNLQITYSKDDSITKVFGDSIGGAYVPSLNHIYISDANNFEEADLRVFIHELLHMLQIYSKGNAQELAVTIAQGEILDYLIDNGEVEVKDAYYDCNGALTNTRLGYPASHPYLYLTFKLISPEARIKYLFQTDEKIIADELIKIDSSSDNAEKQNRAYRLIDCLNQLNVEPKEECFEILKYYYMYKFGKPSELDLDAVLAFYDDYDYTYITKDGELLTLIPKVNRNDLENYLGCFGNNNIDGAIMEALIGDNSNTDIIITAKPSNLFLDPDNSSICYWTQDGKTVSRIVDSEIAEKYEGIIKSYNIGEKDFGSR